MSTESRNECIDAYFSALDENDPSIARPVIADEFVYRSLSGPLEGFDGLSEYITDIRSITDSDHDVQDRMHGDEQSVTQGVVTGTDSDGEPAAANFCDVFEFDADEEAITHIAVYVNDA